jgi:hypothetical protein
VHGCCFRGTTTKALPELARLVAKQEDRGLAVKIHCAGDAAVRTALDAIDIVRSFKGATPLTHHIAHAGFVDPADIRRFKDLKVVADLSPILWYPNQIIDGIEQAVGKRVRQYWPNRDLLEAGVLIATGTDWPVIPNPDPWSGIEGLITRRNPNSQFDGALWPEQGLDLASAIEAYTLSPARAMGIDRLDLSWKISGPDRAGPKPFRDRAVGYRRNQGAYDLLRGAPSLSARVAASCRFRGATNGRLRPAVRAMPDVPGRSSRADTTPSRRSRPTQNSPGRPQSVPTISRKSRARCG